MRYLHIIKDPRETWAWEVGEAQAKGGHEVSVLLWQDGVLSSRETALPLYATAADLEARGVTGGHLKAVDYRGVVELVFQCDRVTCW
ncbi:MAG: DsrH/TusB family sulfur metabolism protein [Candidatus Methylomirabilales bacterium]